MAVRWVQSPGMPYPLADVRTAEDMVDFGTLIRERTEAMSFDRYADFVHRTTGMATSYTPPVNERLVLRAVGRDDGQVYFERMFTSRAQAEAAQRVFERQGQVHDSGIEVQWNISEARGALQNAP